MACPVSEFGRRATSPDCPCAERIILHVLGQSNACGRAVSPSGYTPQNWFNPNGSPATDNTVFNDINNRYGVEMALMNCLSAPCEDGYLVKSCGSGLSIPEVAELLPDHIDTASSLELPPPNRPGCEVKNKHLAVWIQGENEANNTDGSAYQSDEMAFFNQLISVFPSIQIFSVLLNPAIMGQAAAFAATPAINAAKNANANASANITAIGPYAVSSDNVHYDNFDAMAADICVEINNSL